MTQKTLIVDALAAGSGKRTSSRDSIGCGPRSIAGIFEKSDIQCRIKRAEELLQKPARMKRFSHIAISAMTMDLPATQSLIGLWRYRHPSGKVILGGPITQAPEHILKSLKPDVLVVGEGEATLDELLSAGFLDGSVSLSSIDGIGYLEEGKPVLTDPRTPLSERDISKTYIPSTVRIVDYTTYPAAKVYVETVRGCSNFNRTRIQLPDGRKCSMCGNCDSDNPRLRMNCPEGIPPGCGFCSVPSVWGPPRSRSANSIVDEVQELLELGVHRIVLEAPGFLDYFRGRYPLTNPCNPPPNLDAISDLLDRLSALPQFANGTAHLSIENIKACLFDESIAQILSQTVPETSPNIGLETGSEEHRQRIGKCGTISGVLDAVEVASEYNLNPYVYLIYGLPGETKKTVAESIKLMHKLHEAGTRRIILYGFRPLPRSAFESFPPPQVGEPVTKQLRMEAARINRDEKQSYMGKTIRGVAAEPSWSRHGYTMVYPLGEGPIMTVHGGFTPGTLLDVKITDVLSENLLAGKVVRS
ncbi:MAG: B12-binding domain-containing radical SAM protein [Promethearchaeia archaeon]